MSFTFKLSSALAGAGLMYFLDPDRGHRRRAKLADAAVHARRRERELVAKAVRDGRHRMRGLAERAKRRRSDRDAPDEVIEGRVHARLGRAISHAHAIELSVNDGCVVLRGDVLEREADAALDAVRDTAGVHDVIDELERHETAGSVPMLQGEGRVDHRGDAWTPVLQLGAIGAGSLMAIYGLARRGIGGLVLGAAGGALVTRAIANRPLRVSRKGIVVQKTLTVNAPVEHVREQWRRLDQFPLFLDHVRSVEVFGKRSRWTVEAFPGTSAKFDVEITRDEPDVIAWRTPSDQLVQHEGTVRFERVDSDAGTRVHIDLSYRPFGGVLGHVVAHVLGFDPKHRMDDDLVRLKRLFEGRSPLAQPEPDQLP